MNQQPPLSPNDQSRSPQPPAWVPPGMEPGPQSGQQPLPTVPKKHHRVRTVLLSLVGIFVLLMVVSIAAGLGGGGHTQTIGAPGPAHTGTLGASPSAGSSPGGAATGGAAGSGTAASPGAVGSGTVTYRITSDATQVSPSWMTATGTAQATNATAPWTMQVGGGLTFASLVAQMSSGDGTTITCSIEVDGKVVAQQTSTGQYAVVSCFGL